MGKDLVKNFPCYLAGTSSAGLSLYFLLVGMDHLSLLFASAFLFAICLTDTFCSRIPNTLTVGLALAGFTCQYLGSGVSGLRQAALGLFVGLGLFLLPYLLGGMGGGDVKALAALGTLLGPGAIFQVFLYTALVGSLLSVLHCLTRAGLLQKIGIWWAAPYAFWATLDRKSFGLSFKGEQLRFPYAAAIAFGYFAYLHWGRIV